MQSRQGHFEVREQKLTTITHVSPQGQAYVGAIQARDTTFHVDPVSTVKLLEAKLELAHAENQRLRQQLLDTNFELFSTQQVLQSTKHSFAAMEHALHIVEQVSSSTMIRLQTENQSLLAKLSMFHQPVMATVVQPAAASVDTSHAPPPLTL